MNAMDYLLAIGIAALVFIGGVQTGMYVMESRTIPQCEEDEYIYPSDFPDGPLMCVHADQIENAATRDMERLQTLLELDPDALPGGTRSASSVAVDCLSETVICIGSE